jgi:ABC-type Co2+ transport system permease subunit
MSSMVNFSELVKRIIKYLVLGIVIALVAVVIPKKSLNLEEVIILALSAAATFSILDVFITAMGASARGGAGFGLGANLIGGLKLVA